MCCVKAYIVNFNTIMVLFLYVFYMDHQLVRMLTFDLEMCSFSLSLLVHIAATSGTPNLKEILSVCCPGS